MMKDTEVIQMGRFSIVLETKRIIHASQYAMSLMVIQEALELCALHDPVSWLLKQVAGQLCKAMYKLQCLQALLMHIQLIYMSLQCVSDHSVGSLVVIQA